MIIMNKGRMKSTFFSRGARPKALFQGLLLVIFCTVYVQAEVNKCPPPENIMPCRCRGRNDQIQVWCSHSDLERVNGALENLMRLRSMPAIDELIVENNKMPTLPARAFGALQIGRLLLRNNGLESLSRNAFAGLEDSLEEIYIVEDKLVDFPFDSIEKLRNLEAFTLEKSRIRLLPRFNGLNRLKHIRLDGSLITGFPVGAFASMSSIKQIHVVNSNVERLAEGIFGRLDSLILANFSGNRIDHIQRRCFALLPRLEVLALGNNRLSDGIAVGRSMEELSSLKSLDVSNNQIKELPEGSFVNLRSLQLLNLAGNQLTKVHTRSFTHLPALRKVDLSSNLLRNFPRMLFDTTPLLEELRMRRNLLGTANEVGEVLSSLKSLRYLDLGENGVTELPTGAIRDHTHIQTLDLSDNQITKIQSRAFQNVPSLQEISLKNNSIASLGDSWEIESLRELDISSNALTEILPAALKGLPRLQRVDFSHNAVKSLVQGTFSNNKDIEFLDVSSNGLTTIYSEALQGLKKLNKLDLCKNHLESLQSGSFRDLVTLQSLNLANNRINNVPPNLLNELIALEDLNFRSNSLAYIPQGFFQSLKALKELNLKHNSIQEINSMMFRGLENLEQLKLSSNQIARFDDAAFDNLPKLRGIDLNSNRLSRLVSRSFQNLPMLERFEARENRINQVEPGVLGQSEALQIVDLAHNALTAVPPLVKKNPLLKVIDLSHNQITDLDKDVFKQLNGLMELYLNDNKIKSLQPGTFENLGSLTIVDLDGNEMVEISSGTFKTLPRLIYLRMSRNKIKSIARGGFSNLNALDGLDLQENVLEEISPGGFEKTGALKYLNLSHNNLDMMGRMGLLSLGSLEVLDLSFNKLSTVDTDALRHLIWLVELRMNDNGICTIPPGTFDGMSRLKMLVIRNNRLKNLYESVFYKLRNNIAFLDVSGNPLECDCEMTWLRNLMAREEVQELKDSTCETPVDLKGTSVKEARPGRMICTSSSKRGYSQSAVEECPPLAQSKRRSRPSSVETEDRPLFGGTVHEEFYSDPGQNELKNNRRKDEKLIESNDYVSGDTPTIYAGSSSISSSKTNAQDIKKSSSNGGGVLSSLFGIPLDFGFNFGISPAFSWTDKDKNKGISKGGQSGSEGQRQGQDPLPPSWIERPSRGSIKAGNVYEAPEYLPRKPSQPYIPLNPLNSDLNSQSVMPSGSIDVVKRVPPHENSRKSSGIKFPTSEGSAPPPRTSWHPNYPSAETGFIPIEPFFHNKASPKKNATGLESAKYRPTTAPSVHYNQIHSSGNTKGTPLTSTTEKSQGHNTYIDHKNAAEPPPSNPQLTGSSSTALESEEYEEDEPNFTPVNIQTTETVTKDVKGSLATKVGTSTSKDEYSLSNFWGIFDSNKNKTEESQDETKLSNESSYEDVDDNTDSPFNFSAPVDAPLLVDNEEEYNIPFGEPSSNHHNNNNNGGGRAHITGKPTITKIIETGVPFNNNDNPNPQGSRLPELSPSKGNYIQEIDPNRNLVDGSRNGVESGRHFDPSRNAPRDTEFNSNHRLHYDEEDNPRALDNPSPAPLIPPVIIGNKDAEPKDWYYTNYHKSSGHNGGDELLERLLERSRANQVDNDFITLNSDAPRITISNFKSFNSYLLLSFLYYFIVVN